MISCLCAYTGYEIEFHIVVLGAHSHSSGLQRYHNLAAATGGGFMALDGLMYSEKDAKVKTFLNKLKESNETVGNEQHRKLQQQAYLAEAKKGKHELFDWLKLQ